MGARAPADVCDNDYRRRRLSHDRVNALRGAVWGVALAAREFRNYATTNNLDPASYASQAVTALYWERVPVDPTILAYGRHAAFTSKQLVLDC